MDWIIRNIANAVSLASRNDTHKELCLINSRIICPNRGMRGIQRTIEYVGLWNRKCSLYTCIQQTGRGCKYQIIILCLIGNRFCCLLLTADSRKNSGNDLFLQSGFQILTSKLMGINPAGFFWCFVVNKSNSKWSQRWDDN